MTMAGGNRPTVVPGPELLTLLGESRSACAEAIWFNTKINTIEWTRAHIRKWIRRCEFRPIMEDSYLQIVLSPFQYLTPLPEWEQGTACLLPRHTLFPRY